MRALTLSSGLLAVALIGGPQTAVAQKEFSTGRGIATQLPPAGGGEFLPPPAEPNPATKESTSTRLPPAGGGEFLPPPAR